MRKNQFLTVTDHNRQVNDFRYVYPVVSRRARGVSIGINLNINNACNWRCIYCQVPDLKRDYPPPIDLKLLQQELEKQLQDVLHGDFFQRYVAESDRHLQDIAFSGNGEPTSAKEFPQVVALVESTLKKFDLLGKIKVRLITNGSLIDKPAVQTALSDLARCNGEVWFKLDAGTKAGIAKTNDVNIEPSTHIQRLIKCAERCPTYVQTCMFALDGAPPAEEELTAYLSLLAPVAERIQGVHLYGLARPSLQAEAPRLSRLPIAWLESLAERIRALGIETHVSE